jgi:hypothetical protein
MKPIEFTLTAQDLLQASRLHYARSLFGPRAILFAIAFALIASGSALILSPDESGGFAIWCVIAAYVLAMAFLVLLIWYVILPMGARRQLNQKKELGSPQTFDVQSPFVAITTSYGFAKIPTEDLVKWTESKRIILLYRADRQFNLIPKRAITAAFHAALVAELERAGVRKVGAKRRPVVGSASQS